MSMEKAAAMADTSDLGEFEGADVLACGIEIPSAGGGLRESMAIEPQLFHKGERVMVVLDCVVAKVRFEEIKDTDALRRVHIFTAQQATIVDEDLVRSHLEAQQERIARAKEAAAGVARLEFPPGVELVEGDEDDETAVLVRQHGQAAHADGLRENCPLCNEERDLEELGE